jgi:hypothetical protein
MSAAVSLDPPVVFLNDEREVRILEQKRMSVMNA